MEPSTSGPAVPQDTSAGAPQPQPETTIGPNPAAQPAEPAADAPSADTPTPPEPVNVEYRLSSEGDKHFFKKYENGGLVFTSPMFATPEAAEAAMEEAKAA